LPSSQAIGLNPAFELGQKMLVRQTKLQLGQKNICWSKFFTCVEANYKNENVVAENEKRRRFLFDFAKLENCLCIAIFKATSLYPGGI
jgi:hypothetical protein